MTNFDENVSKFIAFAQESEKNKKQALNALAFALAAINSEKKLSDEDLKSVSGGNFSGWFQRAAENF